MGSPLGPLMANAFMVKVEQQARHDGRLPPFYRRYVDDSIALFTSKQESDDFLSYLNSVHPALKFTCELAENSVLPFLGRNITCEDGRIAISA